MAKTLCITCNKCPPGKLGCGIHACLDVARREGASVAVGYEKGETTIVVMCSEYTDKENEK
jgi:hypothetical protein